MQLLIQHELPKTLLLAFRLCNFTNVVRVQLYNIFNYLIAFDFIPFSYSFSRILKDFNQKLTKEKPMSMEIRDKV